MSISIATGHVTDFVLVVAVMITSILFLRIGRKYKLSIRKMAALDAIEEMVGRCTEMGKPFFLLSGSSTTLVGRKSAQTIAALNIASYVTEFCAKTKTKVISVTASTQIIPLTVDIMRTEYIKAGALDAFDPVDQVRFPGNYPIITKYSSGAGLYMETEGVGAASLVGCWEAQDKLMLGEIASRLGAMSIGGSENIDGMPQHAVTNDYLLIAEECYAAGAYISKDPAMLGTLITTDIYRVIISALLIIGIILSVIGSSYLVDLVAL